MDSAEDEEEIRNYYYAFTIGISIAAISRDEHSPVLVRRVEVKMFIESGERLIPFLLWN
jgi:hypothetical protein